MTDVSEKCIVIEIIISESNKDTKQLQMNPDNENDKEKRERTNV